MAFGATILEDSISPEGVRLTTFEMEFPRYIQAEVNTHKMLSKNSASSRAIPVATMLKRIVADPYTPVYWGSNKKGMQAGAELSEDERKACLKVWLDAMKDSMRHAGDLRELGLHKQDANRIIEPWMWQKVIITGTEWGNFFSLRDHADAHPAFQTVAAMMHELYHELEPKELKHDEWHLPLVTEEEMRDWVVAGLPDTPDVGPEVMARVMTKYSYWVKVSAGRCARTSTLTHDGKRNPEADVGLHDKLLLAGHMSPFEHQARPATFEDRHHAMVRWDDVNPGGRTTSPNKLWFGNFRGWFQYRKMIPYESDIMSTVSPGQA